MGKTYEELDERLQRFILGQKMFFVASAPRSDDGLVNISPKGFDTLRILDSKTVAYLDLTGSGVESIAHIKENGRFVVMFCSFDKTPLILRLHGRGQVIERSDVEWATLQPLFPEVRAARAIIKLSIDRVADSCGWGVPMYEFAGTRDQYSNYMDQLDDEGLRQAQMEWNEASINGLPGLKNLTE
jgi:hypothetical protein